MGALPTRKLSRARSGRKHQAYRLKRMYLSYCPQCGAAKLPHRACLKCGFYKGRQVFRPGGDDEEI